MIFQVLGGASTWTCLLRILWKLPQNIFETTVPAYCGWWGWWYARYRKNFCLSFTEVCKQGGKCILDDLFIWCSAAAACCTAKLVCRQIEGTSNSGRWRNQKPSSRIVIVVYCIRILTSGLLAKHISLGTQHIVRCCPSKC